MRNYTIPGFLPDGHPLMLPDGARIAHIDKGNPAKWALYVHDGLDKAWLAIRAFYQGELGWKIIKFSSIPSIQYVNDYVKSCNQCLEKF